MPRTSKVVPKLKRDEYQLHGKDIAAKIEELVMAVDMSDNTGKVVHSGGKRKVKAARPGEILWATIDEAEEISAKDPKVFGFAYPELVILAAMFLWACTASFYVVIDLFFFDI